MRSIIACAALAFLALPHPATAAHGIIARDAAQALGF